MLAGLIWLVIPMAWTYLNDRVFYAHQMTWMTFRLQCVSTGLSTVGALVAATMVPSLTAFTLSIGQALAYVVTASVGFWVLRRQHGHLGLRGTGLVYLKLAVPAVATALALSWLIRTLLPDLGETRGRARVRRRRASCWGWPASSSSPSPGASRTPGGARDRRGARAVHAAAPTTLSPQCLLWAHTCWSRVVSDVRAS